MSENKNKGNNGEEIATSFLEKKGYKILFRNWRFLHKEIDIVATFKNELIIVEVKTRASGSLVSPIEAVNLRKQRFIIDAANAFIVKHNVNLDVRFDVITVINKFNTYEIEHIENAFYPKVR
jgi:putative endonuclease